LSPLSQDKHAKALRPSLGLSLFFLVSAIALTGSPLIIRHLPDFVGRLFYELAGIFSVTAAVFLTACVVDAARHREHATPRSKPTARRAAHPKRPILETLEGHFRRLSDNLSRIDWLGGWLPVIVTLVLSLVTVHVLTKAWPLEGEDPSALADQIAAGALILAAFPFLVIERHLATVPDRAFPELAALRRLCRIPLFGCLALGLAEGLRWLGLSWWAPVEHGVDIVVGLVALELLLRSAVYFFLPLPAAETRRSPADSFVAGLIRLQKPSFQGIAETVRQQFGIDLARSWALDFLRRAAFPVMGAMVLVGWLLSGVTALGLDERAVYESFGRPQAVFHPGLHLHLPWPFGILKPVELGIVHEIPILFETEDASSEDSSDQTALGDPIEGAPPDAANRLWDASHPSEASYLVASLANGRQSFEVVNIDLRIAYRIGLSDSAAEQAIYDVDAPEAMIRSTAGQMLARYFARYTIPDVLGQNREKFIGEFQHELQSRLTDLATGIDIMAVVVEAIHPPPDAAVSYQGVQASAIRSVVQVSAAKATAVRNLKEAQRTSVSALNEASAAAAERVEEAKADFTLFDGDRKAYLAGGAAFLFERRLDRLDQSLANVPLIIVDHRIPPAEAPTLDLRPSPVLSGLIREEQ
jgi:regulator of protease activity HflC (stomatin/prohibitin superfamily)